MKFSAVSKSFKHVLMLSCALPILVAPLSAYARAGGGMKSSGAARSGAVPTRSAGRMESQSVGSRGSRTHEENGYRPIDKTVTPKSEPKPVAQPQNIQPVAAPNSLPNPTPSFVTRHPILTGVAAGMAGSWIGNMLFGHSNYGASPSSSGVGPSGLGAEQGAGEPSGMGSMVNWLTLLIAAGFCFWLYRKWAYQPKPSSTSLVLDQEKFVRAGGGSSFAVEQDSVRLAATAGVSSSVLLGAEQFADLFKGIQMAWSSQDINKLKRLATPEMVAYFSEMLNKNVSLGVENHVEDIRLIQCKVQDSWEEEMVYATVLLTWEAKDYTVRMDLSSNDSGYVVDGDVDHVSEVTEAWTFAKIKGVEDAKWLLSAIQQMN